MSLPVALQLFTVKNALSEDFEGTIEKVAAMGYDGVEFAGLFGLSAAKVREIVTKNNLVPISAHVPLNDLLADPDGEIEKYIEIGCEYIVVPYVTEERRPGAQGFIDMLDELKMLGEKCNAHGVTLLYHNHDFEFVKVDGKYGLDLMYETVPASLLKTELDTCWVNVGGENPAKFVLKYSGRTPVVHLKDFVMKGFEKPKKLYDLIGIDDKEENADEEAFSFKPVGYGVQDMPAILDACTQSGAKWVVVEQDNPDKGNTELNAAKMSREYLKSIGW